ncbi:DUF4474 domain-containing protein [[Clostridium] fimetarium]|uniref:DUF4474 domain-containing protein n=1 Tax=[Clostridium] fimetarium TaxID=99656 RepID=A0A1I0R0Z7_9FIRM|nr:DUF4474 domain-containing protein [[Clostridium] fimetarium]SEW33557.1 protein of unknown function [[Clostridium] fimetarium]
MILLRMIVIYIAYHSQPDTWQRSFGYNDLYDDIFRIGSNMNYIHFNTTGNNYVLWLWKGDYWNLHSGAEIGLYTAPQNYEEEMHYDAINFELPMKLSLYNYYSKNNIQNIFNWSPKVKQWWVTGFNANFKNPNPDVMVSIGSIDFSGHESIFNELKRSYNGNDNMIFDENGHTLWISWK